MALFKILKGTSSNLGASGSTNSSVTHEGWCYFTTDTKKLFIDLTSNQTPSSTNRVALNAALADNVIGVVAITNGGTGSTSAANARTALGLGSAATQNSTAFAAAAHTQTIATGGTGATNAANARTNLGLGSAATCNSTAFAAASHTHSTLDSLVTITRANHSNDTGIIVNNTDTTNTLKLGYIIGNSGNGGIYDYTHGTWKVQITPDGTTTFNGNIAWSNITGKPSSYTPASHTHNYAGSASAGGPATSLAAGMTTNDLTTYTNVKITTAKGGYYGVYCGAQTGGINLMASLAGHMGLFVEGKVWVLDYDYANNNINLGGSGQINSNAGYINLHRNVYCSGTFWSIGANEHLVGAKNTTTGAQLILTSGSNTDHGVYSYGYSASASSFVSSAKWMVYRNSSDEIHLNGFARGLNPMTAASSTNGDIRGAITAYWNSNKSNKDSLPRGKGFAIYSTHSGAAMNFGYFLSGYDDTPYGGFFSAYYSNCYYIGISGGIFTQQQILTSTNYSSYCAAASHTHAYAASSHTHSYLALSGGTLSGDLSINSSAAKGFYVKVDSALGGYLAVTTLGTTSTEGKMRLSLGNSTATGSANNYSGQILMYNSAGGYAICNGVSTALGGTTRNAYDFGYITCTQAWGAVWNDYAEFRKGETTEGGWVVSETEEGTMRKSEARLQAGCKITSDTYGFAIGQTETEQTPIAVCGRVLVYPYGDKSKFYLGAPVCAAPGGTVDIMTREEVMMYPDRIIGTVSEIPKYNIWKAGRRDGESNVPVNGRIWIYVR